MSEPWLILFNKRSFTFWPMVQTTCDHPDHLSKAGYRNTLPWNPNLLNYFLELCVGKWTSIGTWVWLLFSNPPLLVTSHLCQYLAVFNVHNVVFQYCFTLGELHFPSSKTSPKIKTISGLSSQSAVWNALSICHSLWKETQWFSLFTQAWDFPSYRLSNKISDKLFIIFMLTLLRTSNNTI